MNAPQKACFLSPLRSEDLPGGTRWRLLAPLTFYSKVLERLITVETGFEADSYSAPQTPFGSWIVRDIDRRPAFIHDKLYTERSCTREEADLVLLEAMEAVGISWWRRRLIYRGVRVGGGFFWGEDDDAPQSHDSMPGG